MVHLRGRFLLCAALLLAAPGATRSTELHAARGMELAMWDLTDLYPSPEDWSAEYERIKGEAQTLTGFKGRLGLNAGELLRALDMMSRLHRESGRLHTYASLKADEDLGRPREQERRQQAGALNTLIAERGSYLAPELLALGPDRIASFLAQSPDLRARHDFFLNNTLRAAPHILGAEAESVLAAAGDVLQQPDSVYGQLANADFPYPLVTLSDGTEVRLDQSGYEKYRQSSNRADRKLVFDAFWGAWKSYEGTAGAILTSGIMGNIFRAKTRKHPNALAAALFPDAMPEKVYRQLVAAAETGLPALHRYFRLRKTMLGIEDALHYYDVYPSMFPNRSIPKFTIAESERLTLAALAPYGDEYRDFLKMSFAGKWTDPYPRAHKASGAYMNGSAYDVHPYVLLNHNDDYEGLSTFAHEWGHAVHTLLTTKNQPYEKSNYSTFIAESASIANEMLLNDHMVAQARSREEKLYYLGEGLESIRGTFFRQVMFAEFELALHEEIERGRPLSGARMTELYCALLRKFHGEAEGVMAVDAPYCIEWAFVPHFFYNFYVYQYATSMAGAAEFTAAINGQGPAAAARFLDLLRAGGSEYPYELYRRAGVDLAEPAPYRALIARMNRIMDDIEALRR
jgi:oligoendopeptidase F